MSITNYGCQALLNYMFGKTSNFDTQPTIYVALFTSAPGEDGTGGTEVSGGSYAREETASGDWNSATDADPSVIDNANVIDFGTTTGSWGTVTHFGLYDASTSGNALLIAALDTPRSIGNGEDVSFPAGDLNVTMD